MEKANLVEITRTSSKGQVVIPTDIRKRLSIREGSLFFITSRKDMIVMRKISTKMSNDELKTLKGVEEAWKDLEVGRYKVYSKASFSKELAKW